MDQLKLSMDLVPQVQWYQSLYRSMPQTEWKRIRSDVVKSQNGRCAICGSLGKLYCHEVFEYDDQKLVQRLVGFLAICGLCNGVKHFGRSQQLAAEGKIDLEDVIHHFMKVNSCTREDFDRHKAESFAMWRERSTRKWIIDLGEYSKLGHSPSSG